MSHCSLCALELTNHPITDGIHTFCCNGCHAVYNILSSKNQLENFQENPLFLQALNSGIISNPAIIEEIRSKQVNFEKEQIEKVYLEIGNMWCPSCAEIIRLLLLREKGMRQCVVDYATDLASVEFAPKYLSKDKIFQIIQEIGYHASLLQNSQRKAVSFDLYLRFSVAAFCSLNIMMFAYPLYASYFDYDGEGYGPLFAWLSLVAVLPVLGYSAWPIFRRFFTSLRTGFFGMETLVIIGICAAFGLSVYDLVQEGTRVYFDSMSVIIVFVLLGKIIEARAKFSAKEAIVQLSRSSPRRGRKRMDDGSSQYVLMKEIAAGDTLIALTGEKIILDGVVMEGEGSCDESLMTGESIPIVKCPNSSVLGGSILKQGWIAYRVTGTFEESALKKIIEMVEQDIGNKTVYVRAADQVVRWFVPLVITIALLVALICWGFGIVDQGKTVGETAVLRAVAILLISCPCAIGIAAPLAESYLLNGMAALGAIVRNRGCLSYLGRETTFIFDKTGTITEGKFAVLSGFETLSDRDKAVLKGLTSFSNHPIASATERAIEVPSIFLEKAVEVAGRGLFGELNNDVYYFGSSQFLAEQGVEQNFQSKTLQEAVTSVYFAKNKQILAHLQLGDRIREDARSLVQSLKPIKSWLVSGDGRSTVEFVANACGFEAWKAECHPLQKREFIESLKSQKEVVCMLGDGINDAPALTASHVGISVVSASDMSIQVSDILLTTDRLQVLTKIRALAKQGRKIVKQNLFWAFFYNVVGIGLAAFGVLSPIFAAFAMAASSLMVLFNARRIK